MDWTVWFLFYSFCAQSLFLVHFGMLLSLYMIIVNKILIFNGSWTRNLFGVQLLFFVFYVLLTESMHKKYFMYKNWHRAFIFSFFNEVLWKPGPVLFWTQLIFIVWTKIFGGELSLQQYSQKSLCGYAILLLWNRLCVHPCSQLSYTDCKRLSYLLY